MLPPVKVYTSATIISLPLFLLSPAVKLLQHILKLLRHRQPKMCCILNQRKPFITEILYRRAAGIDITEKK